jgi:tetratricopeptide (TPR) repeat protein
MIHARRTHALRQLFACIIAVSALSSAPARAIEPPQRQSFAPDPSLPAYLQAQEKACLTGRLQACFSVASAYLNGDGIDTNLQRATVIYAYACARGSMTACGMQYAHGLGKHKDLPQALQAYTSACRADEAHGCAALGVYYQDGIVVEKDLALAELSYKKACDGDCLNACTLLGELYIKSAREDAALELLNRMIQQHPIATEVVTWFGQILEIRKKINEFRALESCIRRILAFFDESGRWVMANQSNKSAIVQARQLGEVYLLFLANHWHLAAQKAEKQKKRKVASALYLRTARDYERFLARYPASTKAYMVHFYYAEVLYHELNDFRAAIAQYRFVMMKEPKGRYIEEAALGVIYSTYEEMCRQKVRDCSDSKSAPAKPIKQTPLDPLEHDYIAAADLYVRKLLALREDPDFMKKEENKGCGAMIPEVMYMAADTFFVHGDFANALERLKKIFEYDPKHKFAAIASVRMIQAYARLRRWKSVEEWARKLIKERNYKFKSIDDLQRYIAIAINERAMDLAKRQRTIEAITELERLLREFGTDQRSAEAIIKLASLYKKVNRIRDSKRMYRKACEMGRNEACQMVN